MSSMLRIGVVVAISLATQAARAGEPASRPEPRATAGAARPAAPASGYDAFGKMDAVTSYGATLEVGKARAGAGGYDPYQRMDAVSSTSGGGATSQADAAFVQRTWWGP